MTAASEALVTVAVPARNAAATIDETLTSVRAQTHRELEIVVDDDGSSDATAAVVERHGRDDPRIRLLSQGHKGVAAARNPAIDASRAPFVATIDADDLWHPQKIERQLRAMQRGGERVGLVYTWSVLLDEQSRVTALGGRYLEQGDVLRVLCELNMVGNGSTPLMRTDALRRAGGYDVSLVARNAQGCEDLQLYLSVGEHCAFAVVPAYLTGYRRLPGNMSGNSAQMWRSFEAVVRSFGERRPDLRRHLREGLANMCHSGYLRAAASHRRAEADEFVRHLVFEMPYYAVKALLYRPARRAARRLVQRKSRLDAGEVRGAKFLDPATHDILLAAEPRE
jgi:glycosyltransferase involved in cell wall biosynthesis